MKTKKFTVEKKLISQIRYFEELYVVYDKNGERIYTGSKATANLVSRLLTGAKKRKSRK